MTRSKLFTLAGATLLAIVLVVAVVTGVALLLPFHDPTTGSGDGGTAAIVSMIAVLVLLNSSRRKSK